MVLCHQAVQLGASDQLQKWPQALREVMAAYRRDDLKSHPRADCLYTGISSGPNAR